MGLLGAGAFSYSGFKFMSAGDVSTTPYQPPRENPEPGGIAVSPTTAAGPAAITLSTAAIPPGEALVAPIGTTPVVVVNSAGGFKAFIATCPHLGCVVRWKPELKIFACPCHGGTFNPDGQVLSGPPPEGLRKCRVDVKGGALTISLG